LTQTRKPAQAYETKEILKTPIEENDEKFIKDNASMYLDTYQYLAGKTALYEKRGQMEGLVYCVLGLAGEAGELANKVKKTFGRNEPLDKKALEKELGDILWYVSQAAFELGANLQGVGNKNLNKLWERKKKGVLTGSGDDR